MLDVFCADQTRNICSLRLLWFVLFTEWAVSMLEMTFEHEERAEAAEYNQSDPLRCNNICIVAFSDAKRTR